MEQLEKMIATRNKCKKQLDDKIFKYSNSDPEVLNYCLDVHYLDVKTARSFFQTWLLDILTKLRTKQIQPNAWEPRTHLLKIVCGGGKGR